MLIELPGKFMAGSNDGPLGPSRIFKFFEVSHGGPERTPIFAANKKAIGALLEFGEEIGVRNLSFWL